MDDELVWLMRAKRRSALVMLVLGLVAATVGTVILVINAEWTSHRTIESRNAAGEPMNVAVEKRVDPRIVGGAVAAVGLALTLAGAVRFSRAKKLST